MDRDKNLTAADLARFETLLSDKLGFFSDSAQRDNLAQILSTRIGATDCQHASGYFRLIENSGRASSELQTIADQLAVKETYFFRGLDHWQTLFDRVLPDLATRNAGARQLRVLCAGCSSGEEPYTLAILLREAGLFDESWDVDILGVDISPSAIGKARTARYSPWSLRNTDTHIKSRYFRHIEHQFELTDSIRRSVRFEVRNLLDEDSTFWHPGAFDVIFCRNVFIYFTTSAIVSVVNRFAGALNPGGYLFLGHAETLRGITRNYHLRGVENTFFYQVRYPGEPPESSATFDLWQQALESSHADPGNFPSHEATQSPVSISDDSWVEATQRVTERIEKMTLKSKKSAAPTAVSPFNWAEVMELYSCERYAEVEKLLDAPARSGDRDALLMLAVVLTNHGRLAEAEKVCRTLLSIDEFNAGASYLLALCREHAGDIPSAEAHLQSSAYLDPQFSMPHLQLGRLARRLGRLDAAQRSFRRALELLAREDSARLLLFGGGFSRDMLSIICRDELIACGGKP